MNTYEQFKKLNLDFGCIGLQQWNHYENYYCTPEDAQIARVTLHRNDGSSWLSLSFDAPVVGIWSPPGKVAPFICIEPWYGRCDRVGYEGEYKDKDWINSLTPGGKFESVYTIEIA